MPMADENLYGKNADGSRNEDYCSYCFPNGVFNNPNETMEEMIETWIPFMLEGGDFKDADTARKVLQEQLPELKRWKKTA
jgi:hypothetical protein